MVGRDRGLAVGFLVLGEEGFEGVGADGDGGGREDAFGGLTGEGDELGGVDAIRAHEVDVLEADVGALLGEARAFGNEADEVDQLRIGSGDVFEDGTEVGFADVDSLGGDDLATEGDEGVTGSADEAFAVGGAVMDGGDAPDAEGVVDEVGGDRTLDGVSGDNAVEGQGAVGGQVGSGAGGADHGQAGGLVDALGGDAGGGAHMADDGDDVLVGGEAVGDGLAAFAGA